MDFYENDSGFEAATNLEEVGSEQSPHDGESIPRFDSDSDGQEVAFDEGQAEETQQAPKPRRKKKAAEEPHDEAEDAAISADNPDLHEGNAEDDVDDGAESMRDEDSLPESSNEPRRVNRRSQAPAVLDGEGRVIHERMADNGQYELSIVGGQKQQTRVICHIGRP